MNKKQLYESIMASVAKEVKNVINEGAWGYEPDQADDTLDSIGLLYDDLTEMIYDRCVKLMKNKQSYFHNAWDVIAIIEHYFEKMSLLSTDTKDKTPYWKYYRWWKLKKNKGKDIIALYQQAIEKCENDTNWLNSWSEPEKMQESLQMRHKILNKYLRLQKRANI